jgi:predicted ATPase
MTSPIESIHLVRFRGFEKASLELKPLTVLLGPNSAGKSSFGHALVGLMQSHGSKSREPTLNSFLRERLVDFGSPADAIYDSLKEPLEIGLGVAKGVVQFGFGYPSLRLSLLSVPRESTALLQRAGAEILGASQQISLPIEQAAGPISLPDTVSGATPKAHRFERISDDKWLARPEFLDPVIPAFQGLELLSVSDAVARSTVPYPLTHLINALRAISRITYLRAGRSAPERHYQRPADDYGDDVGASGERSAIFLRDHGDRVVEFIGPPPCPRSPDEAMQILSESHTWASERMPLHKAVANWMEYLHLARDLQTGETARGVTVDLDVGGHRSALADVGYGLSQVLPILVAGLAMPDDGLLVVEQPEAQLHPRPQAAIADFFCALAKSGRSSIVETHSEAFFHRLRLRVAMDPKLASLVAVYFLDGRPQTGPCKQPQLVPLEDESPLPWPVGFLTEGVEQELSILAIRAAQSRRARPQ